MAGTSKAGASRNDEPRLVADRDVIGQFFDAVFRHAEPDGFVSLRTFDQYKGNGTAIEVRTVVLNGEGLGPVVALATGCANRAAKHAKAAVFAPAIATFLTDRNAKEDNLKNCLAIVVDCDERSPDQAVRTLTEVLGGTTVVVHSGGVWTDPVTGATEPRAHVYARLTRPTRTPDEHDRLKRCNRLVAALVGSDPSAVTAVHPLRCAGSVWRKASPRPVPIHSISDFEIDLDDALARLTAAATDALEHADDEDARRLRIALDIRGSGPPPEFDPEATDPDFEALAGAIPVDPSYGEWIAVGMGFHAASGGSPAGFNAWDRWSRRAENYGGTVEKWTGFAPTRTDKGALVKRAQRADPSFRLPSWPDRRGGTPQEPVVTIVWPDLVGQEPPEREFVVEGWLPTGVSISLYGPGGVGKSMLAQQLGACVAAGRPFLGLKTMRAPVLGVFCEDDDDELWRRQCRINLALEMDMRGLGDFHPQGRLGMANILMTFPQGKLPVLAALFADIEAKAVEIKPKLIILDNAAQLFGGEENARGEVTAFINAMNGLARRLGAAVLLLGHPPKNEAVYSGSTAWFNVVRGMWTLGKPVVKDDDGETDPKARVLTRHKVNYAPDDGEEVPLHWIEGVLQRLDGAEEVDEGVRRFRARAAFLAALDTLTEQRRSVSHSKQAASYAPKAMKEAVLAEGFSKAALARAMNELFTDGKLAADAKLWQRPNRTWVHGIARKA